MRARAHMAQVLEGTGLYSLTGSTPVDWELDAYSAGFAPLEAAFDKLLADLFAATATRERLAQWEALFRPQPSTAPGISRRRAPRGSCPGRGCGPWCWRTAKAG